MKILKTVFILSILILQNTNASISLEALEENYKRKTRKQRTHLRTNIKKATKSVASTAAHQGQALILILMLTGVDLVKQSLELAKVKQEDVDYETLLEHSKEAAQHILTSGEIWSSIIGASTATTTMAKPLKVIDEIIKKSKSRPLLKKLLSNGIRTLTLFLGWELGAQLFIEARELLEDDEEYARAEYLIPMLSSYLLGIKDPKNENYKKDREIVKKLLSNMIEILVTNDDLRNLWLYNAFRQRMATGEFVTLVTSMVGAATVGTAIFPGAGTFGGAMFGLAGGTLSLFIPQEDKDLITEGIQKLRELFFMMGREGHGLNITNYYDSVIKISAKHIEENKPLPPLLKLDDNSTSRNRIISIYFEKMFRLESRLQSARAMTNEAEKVNNLEAYEEYTSKAKSYEAQYYEVIDNLKRIYSSDLEHLEVTLKKYKFDNYMADPNLIEQYEILKNFRKLYWRTKVLKAFINDDLIPQVEEGMSLPVEQKSYFQTLNKFYFLGFDEAEVYKLISPYYN